MSFNLLQPLTKEIVTNPAAFNKWLFALQKILAENGMSWSIIDKTGSSLADLTTRKHEMLTDLLGADETDTNTTLNKHVSNALMNTNYVHRSDSTIHHTQTDINANLPKIAAQSDSTASDVAGIVSDFNTLLGKMRTAGYLTT